MIFWTVFLILLSNYVGASNIKDETKTSFFIGLGIIVFIMIISKIF